MAPHNDDESSAVRPAPNGDSVEVRRTARWLRFYRIALVLSLTLNVLLFFAFWAYLHFEGFLSIIEEAVGVIG